MANLHVWKINFLVTDKNDYLYADSKLVEATTLEQARKKLIEQHPDEKIQFVRYKRLS